MDEIYKEYGKCMVELEILNNRINQLKQKINEGLVEASKMNGKKEEVTK